MANNRIQPQFIRLNDKAIANVTGTGPELNSNDERQITLEGVLGHSDGVATIDFEVKTIIALTGGDDVNIINIILNKLECEIQATIGASVFVVTCRCVSFSGSSEAANGKFEGTYKFESSGNIQLV
jgi:hypothetical protein